MTLENHDWQGDFMPDQDKPPVVPAWLWVCIIVAGILALLAGGLADWLAAAAP